MKQKGEGGVLNCRKDFGPLTVQLFFSAASKEVGLLGASSAVSSGDGVRIWQGINSTRDKKFRT